MTLKDNYYRINLYRACLSQDKLSYASVNFQPNLSGLKQQRFIALSCYMSIRVQQGGLTAHLGHSGSQGKISTYISMITKSLVQVVTHL